MSGSPSNQVVEIRPYSSSECEKCHNSASSANRLSVAGDERLAARVFNEEKVTRIVKCSLSRSEMRGEAGPFQNC